MSIEILAGAKALTHIQEHGLQPSDIRLMVGASGGPKWLMLSRLDQYLAEHFLPKAEQSISLVGSSIGSWRMACHAQQDPLATFKEFEAIYTHQRYESLSPREITQFVDKVLAALFNDERAEHIVNNPKRKLHVVAVRNRLLMNGRHNISQIMGLLVAATGNVFSSKVVEALYPRVLISQGASHDPYHQRPEVIELGVHNLKEALVASGAIPMALEPTKVTGGKDRWHWDGGMVDYHFAGPFNVEEGLVFYPHFFPKIVPGWFDKGIPWRKAKAKNYDNVVVVAPSKEFIAKLPYGKIPDRKDFTKLNDVDRENYWQTVLQATDALVDDFHNKLSKDGASSAVKTIESIL
ncbi:MAG: patatin-like phospholipase family protein [Gammaproteobacteria bacterium]|nr:patatin-like phospholipase family protein [Gammaproteobacteria bacterium]